MSQILDAIKQADDKRKASQSKRIGNPYAFIGNKSAKKSNRLLWLALLVTLVVAGGVFLFYQPGESIDVTTKNQQTPSAVNTAQNQSAQPQQTTNADSTTSEANVASQNTESASKDNAEIAASTQQLATESDSVDDSEVMPDSKAVDTPQLALEIPADKAEADTSKDNEELISEIPQQPLRPELTSKASSSSKQNQSSQATSEPSEPVDAGSSVSAWKEDMTISAIFNHADKDKRFVLIAGKKLKEGDTIPYRDMTLLKIMDNGIIVSGTDGQTFIKTY